MANVNNSEALSVTTAGFAELMLGLSLYEWQARGLLPLERIKESGDPRQNIAIVTPNGSGKDERIIPTAAYYWLMFHPRGRVVITSKSDMQLTHQTIPNLEKHWRKFGWKAPVQSPRYTLITKDGGSLVAYVTNDGSRTEGHHTRPGEPLLLIVNEAKSIDESIWQGIDRCTPDVLLLLSSPGLREGRFYDCFTKLAPLYHTVRAGLADCPHIPKEKIENIVARYGEDSAYTRSALYGEFMAQADGDQNCITDHEYEACILFPPTWKPGFKSMFFDFADGRAENVAVLRNGNKYEIVDAWREHNEDAVVGRSLNLIHQHGLKPEQVKADAAAKSILDKMANSSVAIGRQNFGAIDPSGTYKSWSALAWLEGCQKIRSREVILPDDPVLKSQVVTRRKLFAVNGKLAVEEKYKMLRERGIESPDRADALFGAMAQVDTSLMVNVIPFDFSEFSTTDKRDSIAACVGL